MTVSKRSVVDLDFRHLAIEFLEFCVFTLDLEEAAICIRLFSLAEHVCCAGRVHQLMVQLELLNTGNEGRFFDPKFLDRMEGSPFSDYENLFSGLLQIKYKFKLGKWDKIEEENLRILTSKIEQSPYQFIVYLVRKFELERSIATRNYGRAWKIWESIYELAEKLGLSSEMAILVVVARELAKKNSENYQKLLTERFKEFTKKFGEKFLARVLCVWPYHCLRENSVRVKIVWQSRDHGLIFNNDLKIHFSKLSPLAKFSELIAAKPGKLVSYTAITKKIWRESFRKEYHLQKIHALCFSWRKLVEEHGVDSSFLTNVVGSGYIAHSDSVVEGTHESQEARLSRLVAEMSSTTAITAAHLMAKFSISARQAQRDLKYLCDTGILVALGGKKNRRYRLKRAA